MREFEYLGAGQSITLLDKPNEKGKKGKVLFEGKLEHSNNYQLPEDHILVQNWLEAGWLIKSQSNPSVKTDAKSNKQDKEEV